MKIKPSRQQAWEMFLVSMQYAGGLIERLGGLHQSYHELVWLGPGLIGNAWIDCEVLKSFDFIVDHFASLLAKRIDIECDAIYATSKTSLRFARAVAKYKGCRCINAKRKGGRKGDRIIVFQDVLCNLRKLGGISDWANMNGMEVVGIAGLISRTNTISSKTNLPAYFLDHISLEPRPVNPETDKGTLWPKQFVKIMSQEP